MSRRRLAVLCALTLCLSAVLKISALPLIHSTRTFQDSTQIKLYSRSTSSSFDNVSYADVVKIGAHDSMAIGPHIVDNQHLTVTQQLDLGIRLLQAQGHPWDDPSPAHPSGISLCHTSCYLQNGGYLEDWLREILSWMDRHPDEIVTILVTNPESADIDDWAKGFESLAVYDRAYTPSLPDISRKDWPTYGEMRATNQTLVIFMDRGTSFSKYPYIINEFGNVWENAYDQTSLPFNCSVDRGKNPTDRLGLVNHFLNDEVVGTGIKYPDKDLLEHVNAAQGSSGLLSGFENCTRLHGGARPTFVLVNFSDVPDENGPVVAANMLNNVTNTAAGAVTGVTNSSGVGRGAARSWLLCAAAVLVTMTLVM